MVSRGQTATRTRCGTPRTCWGRCPRSERREFEAHLGGCASCREAVAELSGMPALLASLDRDEVAAIDEPASIGSSADARGSDGARSTGLAGGGAESASECTALVTRDAVNGQHTVTA